jgi:hypothetical protein
MEALFPDANPLALDLLGKMMEFDQARRISVDGALSHPYLMELHSKAKVCLRLRTAFRPAFPASPRTCRPLGYFTRVVQEPVCERPFNFDFEKDYPDEMPQRLLQGHMYREMLAIREEQRRKGMDSVGGGKVKAGTA